MGHIDAESRATVIRYLDAIIARTQRQPPAILSRTPQLASIPLWPQMGLVMAGCWQINSILANIGRRNSIRILNQYPFFWNILIWAQFICILKLFAFKKLKLL